jgi:Sulfotransferase family
MGRLQDGQKRPENLVIAQIQTSLRETSRADMAAQSLHISTVTGVACRTILKCGCTYIKNLLWHLDHGTPHPRGNWVHRAEDDLPRSQGWTVDQMRQNPHAFIILRDPVERFLSLYFDKVMRPRAVGYNAMRKSLIEAGAVDPEATTIQGHRANCHATIDWIRAGLSDKTARGANRHWTRQNAVLREVLPLNLKVLTLNGLDRQLHAVLGGHVPDLPRHLAGAKWRNRSPRPVPRNVLVDDALREAVLGVYWRDAVNWSKAEHLWRQVDHARPDQDKIPRLGREIGDGD